MRILVTGIGGFVGRHLGRWLLSEGDSVSGICDGPRPEMPGLEFRRLDILDRHALRSAVSELDPESIVHLAGRSHVGASWQQMADYFRVNVLGTENVLDAAAGRRVLLASSAEVYGLVPEAEQPIGESRPLDPRSPYAITKAAAERIARREGAVVMRCFNLVGPGQAPHFALPTFARQLAEMERGGEPGTLQVGNLAAVRDFVHVRDGIRAMRRILLAGEDGEVYNIATGRAFSIGQALEHLMSIAGVQAVVEKDPSRFRPVDIPLLRGDAGKLEGLGWSPEHELDDALRELWAEVRERRSSPG